MHCYGAFEANAVVSEASKTSRLSPVAVEILSYLRRNPRACDSLEGIVEWWLLEQHIDHRMEQVRSALRELISAGLVVEEERGGGPRYRVNAEAAEGRRRSEKGDGDRGDD